MTNSLNDFACLSLLRRDTQIFLKLEALYGSYLERLGRKNSLALRAVLCRYIYCKISIKEYLIVDAITDTLVDFDEGNYDAVLDLKELSEGGIEAIIELVTVKQTGKIQ